LDGLVILHTRSQDPDITGRPKNQNRTTTRNCTKFQPASDCHAIYENKKPRKNIPQKPDRGSLSKEIPKTIYHHRLYMQSNCGENVTIEALQPHLYYHNQVTWLFLKFTGLFKSVSI